MQFKIAGVAANNSKLKIQNSKLALSMHQNQQYVDVAWRHAWDARCLSESFGIDAHEFLSALGRYLVEFVIVEVSLDTDVFEAMHLVGYLSFAFDIAVVLDEYLGCFDYFVASGIVRIECST